MATGVVLDSPGQQRKAGNRCGAWQLTCQVAVHYPRNSMAPPCNPAGLVQLGIRASANRHSAWARTLAWSLAAAAAAALACSRLQAVSGKLIRRSRAEAVALQVWAHMVQA